MKRRTKYVIYFKRNFESTYGWYDSIIVDGATERDSTIERMLKVRLYTYIAWERIYANGELGCTHVIIDNR